MALGIASAMVMSLTACQQSQRENPLLQESEIAFGAPDFSKIQPEDYLPAFETAIQQQRENIQKIVECEDSATFENTILPYEESGKLLDRVSRVFFALAEADKTPEIAEIEKQVLPMMTDLENEISFNKPLFERIRQVYDNAYTSLQGEDQKLLEEIYKDFVRKGALLPEDKMERMKAINLRITELQQQWGDQLPAATNDAVVWVDNKEELAGLSEADIAQCQKDAETRGNKAPYAIVIVNTTQQPILASLDNRDLRKKVYEASIHRADGTNSHNTFAIVSEMARLRAEQAEIMGYPNYAAYSLEKTMAKTPENVYAFLKDLIAQYTPKAEAETKAIEDFARKTMTDGSPAGDFKLQPYDRFYYSAKMKKELLNISDEEVKPYFNVDSVLINGVFYAANRAYGLTFKERTDIPLYHPDMKAFEVIDKDGNEVGWNKRSLKFNEEGDDYGFLRFPLSKDLTVGEDYRVVVDVEMKDTMGLKLEAPIEYHFTAVDAAETTGSPAVVEPFEAATGFALAAGEGDTPVGTVKVTASSTKLFGSKSLQLAYEFAGQNEGDEMVIDAPASEEHFTRNDALVLHIFGDMSFNHFYARLTNEAGTDDRWVDLGVIDFVGWQRVVVDNLKDVLAADENYSFTGMKMVKNATKMGRKGTMRVDNLLKDHSTGVSETTLAGVTVGPNPAVDYVVASAGSFVTGMELINSAGQTVARNGSNFINVSGVTPGVYLVRVYTNGMTSTHKVMVAR